MNEQHPTAAEQVAKARERAARLADEAAKAADEAAKLAEEHGIAEEPLPRANHVRAMIDHQALETVNRELEDSLRIITENTSDLALTGADRQRLNGSGVRRLGFIEKILDTATMRPEFIPPFFNLQALTDLAWIIEILRNIRGLALAIDRITNDALLVAGDESYRQALMYYNSVRDAARRRVPGAEELFRILELFFRRGHRTDIEPTETEVLRDAKALLHDHKDGKIVIENRQAHMEGGKHVVVDETHKPEGHFKATEEGEIEE